MNIGLCKDNTFRSLSQVFNPKLSWVIKEKRGHLTPSTKTMKEENYEELVPVEPT
jgi:hypothetical protein